jgi:hypothetical protein
MTPLRLLLARTVLVTLVAAPFAAAQPPARAEAETPAVAPAPAAAPRPDPPSPPSPRIEPADLVIANRTIASLRATRMGYSPAERAADAVHRINDVLEAGRSRSARALRVADGYRILLGDRAVFHVLDADVDGLAEQTPEQASTAAVKRLQEAVDAEWEQRQPWVIAWGTLFSLLATAVCAVVIVAAVKISGRIRRRVLRLPQVAALERLDDEMAAILRRPLVAARRCRTRRSSLSSSSCRSTSGRRSACGSSR